MRIPASRSYAPTSSAGKPLVPARRRDDVLDDPEAGRDQYLGFGEVQIGADCRSCRKPSVPGMRMSMTTTPVRRARAGHDGLGAVRHFADHAQSSVESIGIRGPACHYHRQLSFTRADASAQPNGE